MHSRRPKDLNEKVKASLRRSEAMGLISPLIHVGQFKDDVAKVVSEYHSDVNKTMSDDPESIAKDLNTDVATAKELMEVCSPERLKCPREEEISFWEDIRNVPNDTGLETIQYWMEVNKLRLQLKVQSCVLKSKYTEHDCSQENSWKHIPAKDDNDKIKCPESIISVAVNFPRTIRKFKHTTVNYRVLGSQNLTKLRDVIPCTLDEQPIGHFTDNPDHPQDIKCKHLFKAGYFFIENTFYHDHRIESSASDLSKPMFEWAKDNNVNIPEDVREVNMEDYTFDDLHLCLGSPYIYVHQGNCEHVIIFKDIRLLHPDDCLSRSLYPHAVSRARTKSEICKVCEHFHACWMTTNDEFSDEDPSFFCDTCFRILHYNRDGTRAGEFQAYPYILRESLAY